MLETLFSCSKPVVAAVNGHAIAGGCVMASAADYRIMAREPGRIGIPELLVGVPFPVVPLEIMRFAVPRQYLQALAYPRSDADRGPGAGARVGRRGRRAGTPARGGVEVAASLAAIPPGAFSLTKLQMRAPSRRRMRAGDTVDADVQDAWASPQTLAAIGEYVARTLKR